MYCAASALATAAASAGSADAKRTLTRLLFRIGATISDSRNLSITRDCRAVSPADGAAFPGSVDEDGPPVRPVTPEGAFPPPSSGEVHSVSASIVRRASSRLFRMLTCVW